MGEIVLYYSLDYYVIVLKGQIVQIQNKYIIGCPLEQYREGTLKKLAKTKEAEEIWQSNGAILSIYIRIAISGGNEHVKTLYDAIRFSGRIVWKYEKDA